MKAEYSHGQFRELDISATALEWLAFSSALGHDGTAIPCDLVDGLPDNHISIRSVRVQHAPARKVAFCFVADATIVVEGDPVLLDTLSKTMANLATQFADGDHIHIDYQGDDHFVAQDSICTVLTRAD